MGNAYDEAVDEARQIAPWICGGYEIRQSQGRQSVSQSDCRSGRAVRTRSEKKRSKVEKERAENAWQASMGSISRGKDKFLIGPRYTDDSLLVDLITPRYGGLYKPPSTARILITFCLKPAKFFLRERERDRLTLLSKAPDIHRHQRTT